MKSKEESLFSIASNYKSMSIIGMSKNAGKTTVLNSIIEKFDFERKILSLTSIGRDGEDVDIVTSTKKPKVYVKKGTLVATAKKMALMSDTTKEILKTTGINTALGEIVIFRAISDGYVQIAGPSINEQIALVCKEFEILGADKIIVDGALHRKTLSSPEITESTILCVGASLARNMDKVIGETVHTYKILSLEKLKEESVKHIIDNKKESEKVIVINKIGDKFDFNSLNLKTTLNSRVDVRQFVSEHTVYIFLAGVITDSVIDDISKQVTSLKKIKFIAIDSSKIIIKPETYSKLLTRGSNILVLKKTNLMAITINPYSAYGNHFDKDEFKQKLANQVTIPVFDVLQEEVYS